MERGGAGKLTTAQNMMGEGVGDVTAAKSFQARTGVALPWCQRSSFKDGCDGGKRPLAKASAWEVQAAAAAPC